MDDMHPIARAGQIQEVLDALARQLADLPSPQQEQVAADLQTVRAWLSDLLRATAAETASAEQPAAEEALTDCESRYRELADSITDPVAIFEEEMRLVYRNTAAQQASLIPNELALGKTFAELYPNMLDSELYQVYLRGMETHQPQTYLNRHDHPDGSGVGYYEINLYPTRRGMVAMSKDVTQRVQAEQALQESERRQRELAESLETERSRLAAILENLPVGVWISAENGRLIGKNEQADRIWAGSAPLVNEIGDYHQYIAWFADSGKLLQPEEYPVAQVIRTGQPAAPVELTIRRFDGTEGTVLVSAAPIRDAEGRLVGTVSINVDITERKQVELSLRESEAQLRESERRFRTMADGTPVIIWVTDPQGNNEFMNRAYYEFFGVTLEEIRRAGWQPLVHPEDMAGYGDVFLVCNQARQPFREQARMRRHDGEWRWIVSQAQPRFSESGDYLGMAGSSLDITEQVHTADALRMSEAREHLRAAELEALMDAAPVMIWIARDPQCLVMTGNEYGYRFLGMGPNENISKTAPQEALRQQKYTNMKDGRQLSSSELPMQIAAATGKPARDFEFDMVFDDGQVSHLLGNVNPLFDHAGNPSGAIGAFVDVTAFRRLQEAQIETRANVEVQRRLMEQREQERQGIARDIHDGPIQTLASTAFNIQFLKEAFPDPTLQVELNQIALNVKNSIRELREVVNDLRPPSITRFGLARAIKMHAEDLRERYPEVDIELHLAETGAQLSDQACLTIFRVFQEGMNNVVRHSGASHVWVHYQTNQNSFTMEVRDDGIGFAVPKDFTHLTGEGHFGLAGMKERVETVGGDFSVRSQPGAGTTLTVRGPLLGKNVKA